MFLFDRIEQDLAKRVRPGSPEARKHEGHRQRFRSLPLLDGIVHRRLAIFGENKCVAINPVCAFHPGW